MGSDAKSCAEEADHLHNIPELIGKSERGYLFYYMDATVPGYVARNPGARERYATEWSRLGELVRRDNKRLNGDESNSPPVGAGTGVVPESSSHSPAPLALTQAVLVSDKSVYDPRINHILLNILGIGIVHIRSSRWPGKPDACVVESDHLHNIPELILTSERAGLSFYLYTTRLEYQLQMSVSQWNFWKECAKLEALVPQDNKRLNGDESKV